jgi:hypothetical protein
MTETGFQETLFIRQTATCVCCKKFVGSLDRMVTVLFPSSSFKFGARSCPHKIRSVVYFNDDEPVLLSGTQNQ